MTHHDAPDHRFHLGELDDVALRTAVHSIHVPVSDDEQPPPLVAISGASGQHAMCMRWKHPVRVQVEGDLGDYAFAWAGGVDVRLHGNVGNGVAEGMHGGVIRVTGNAGVGAGAAMLNGTLAIYGSAGSHCGAAMRGGCLFVRGNVGDDAGAGALAGTIVIGGDAGEHLSDPRTDLTVFIRGKAASLSTGVVEAPLRKREQVRLGLLLMGASIRGNPAEFRRVIPAVRLRAEQNNQGELNPSWR